MLQKMAEFRQVRYVIIATYIRIKHDFCVGDVARYVDHLGPKRGADVINY